MGRMGRQDQGGFSSAAHPTNQKGHCRSSTCMKSRAQVITGEQQMLHLRDGSQTVPDEQEFASEPQRKALPTAAVGSGDQNAASTTQHQVLPPHTFSTDHPHHYRTLMPGTSGSPPRDLCVPQKGVQLFQKQPGRYWRQSPARPPLPTTVKRQKSHRRKTAAAETVPLGRVLNGSRIPSNKSKCTDPIVCINLCTGACTPPHY